MEEEYQLSELESKDLDRQRKALRRLGEMRSQRSIPKILDLLRSSAHSLSLKHRNTPIVDALVAIGPHAVPELTELLYEGGEGGTDVPNAATRVLAEMGEVAKDALPALLERLMIGDQWDRECAAFAVGRIGTYSEEVIAALCVMLTDESELSRAAAACALGVIGQRAASAIPSLQRLVSDESEYVRKQTVDAIARIRG